MFLKVKKLFDMRRNRSDIRSKSGGMLVLSLMLMAVGVILITSAMSVTISARQRFYVEAQSAQARLTATSSAKSIAEAITLTQEIDDKTLEAWANSKSGFGPSSAFILYPSTAKTSEQTANQSAGAPMAPGLIPSSTVVKVYWTDENKNKIALDVTSNVDASGGVSPASERVLVTLKIKEVVPPIDAFQVPLNAGGSNTTSKMSQVYIAKNLTGQTKSSYIILRGTWNVGDGDALQTNADVVFTHPVYSSNGLIFSNESSVVFYGNKAGAMVKFDAAGNYMYGGGNGIQTPGYLLFIGETAARVLVDGTSVDGASLLKRENGTAYTPSFDNIWFPLSGRKGVYFKNTYYSGWGQQMSQNSNALYADTGSIITTNTVGSTALYNVGASPSNLSVTDGSNTWASGAIENFPINYTVSKYNSDEFIANVTRQVRSTDQAVSMTGYTSAASTSGVNLTSSVNSAQSLSGSSYYVNVSSASNLSAHWQFDLFSNDVTLYLTGSGTFTIGANGLIEFINGGTNWGRIILAPDVNIDIEKGANFHGIVSTDRNLDDIKANPSITTDYGSYKPYLYIIGIGGNKVHLNGGILEAYVGLYGNKDIEPSDSHGSFGMRINSTFFGRVEAVNFYNLQDLGGDNGQIFLPYTLGPGDPISKPKQPLVSKYEVESYQYLQP